MQHSHSVRTRGLAAIGTTVLALGSLGLMASPANAAPGDAGTGTVTVYKLEQPNGTIGANDGSQLSTAGTTPLVAGFTACAIDDIDLADAADWNRMKNLSAALNGSGLPVVSEGANTLTTTCFTEQTTDATTGATEFSLDADRAYVIYESEAAVGAVSVAQPTIITVPFPGNGASGQPVWNYNPHIYPKNTIAGSGATKDGRIVGDKITFDVNVPIKALGAGELYTELRVNDTLSAEVKYTAGSVTLTDKLGADVPLTLGADYTLTQPTGNNGGEVVLNFLTPGLAKLDSNIGGAVKLTINADAMATGSTENSARITINGKSTGPGTDPEVIDPQEFFSGAHIMKEAKNKGAASNVALAGAAFNIFPAAAAAIDCPAVQPNVSTAVFTNDVSAASGKTPSHVLAEGKYCVYESVVPNGYKGLQGGLLFEVSGADAELVVVNTQVGADTGDLPQLPLTGAAGSIVLLSTGAILLTAGIVLVVARRRKMHAGA